MPYAATRPRHKYATTQTPSSSHGGSAAWNGAKECVALLLAAGAAPKLKNKDKKTPKMLAAESPNPNCFPLGLPGEF